MSSSHLHAFNDQFEGFAPSSCQLQTLLRALSDLPDPRAKCGIRHPLAHILVIMIYAVIAGAKTLVEIAEWAKDPAFQQLAGYGIRAPDATTIARAFQRLDTRTFEVLLSSWAQPQATVESIVVDGKEVRGAKNGGQERVHLLPAVDQGPGAVCARAAVGTKATRSPRSQPCPTISWIWRARSSPLMRYTRRVLTPTTCMLAGHNLC